MARGWVVRGREAGIDAAWWPWARPLAGALVLAALVVVLGTGPFLEALHATDVGVLALGALIAVGTTLGAAWRWRLVARRLGADLDLGPAVAACYRAQLLNSTLPGGVLGDVGRGVRHGRDGGDVGRGLRGVAWERTAGQLVLVTLTTAALLVARPFDAGSAGTGSVIDSAGPVLAGAALAGVLLVTVLRRRGSARLHRWWGVLVGDLRALGHGPASAGLVAASVVVVAGHVSTFLLAAHAVGVRAPATALVPLALVVLVVGALPVNLAGWGPREGAAAWAFAAAGLGAGQGLATSVVFGAIGLVSTLPGAALLLADRVRRPWGRPSPRGSAPVLAPAAREPAGGMPHG